MLRPVRCAAVVERLGLNGETRTTIKNRVASRWQYEKKKKRQLQQDNDDTVDSAKKLCKSAETNADVQSNESSLFLPDILAASKQDRNFASSSPTSYKNIFNTRQTTHTAVTRTNKYHLAKLWCSQEYDCEKPVNSNDTPKGFVNRRGHFNFSINKVDIFMRACLVCLVNESSLISVTIIVIIIIHLQQRFRIIRMFLVQANK